MEYLYIAPYEELEGDLLFKKFLTFAAGLIHAAKVCGNERCGVQYLKVATNVRGL